MIGETLSHFKVIDKLGQGGMGVVYRGVDLSLDRPVAIKILPPEAQRDEDSVGRFLREAKTASKLQHPAITTIYEFGVKDDLRYLVMEYIEGRTVREMLRGGPLAIRQSLDIALQVADALTLADEKGIIHRDIKSENIMVTERGQVKILDFGLAKMMAAKTGPTSGDTFATTAGLVMGTVSHMSPEQALGADLDVRTDIYSTGVVLFEMATGTLPFTGTSPNIVLAKILNQPAPAPSDFNPEVPPALEQIIRRCMEKNREQRYQNAMQLQVDLKSLKQQVESARDWSGTMVGPGKAPRVAAGDTLSDLVPPASSVGAPTGAALPPQTAAVGAPTATGLGGTAAVAAPGSGGQAAVTGTGALPGTAAMARGISASERAWRTRLAVFVGVFRKVASVLAAAYAMGCVVLFSLPLFRPERVASLAVVRFLRDFIDPALGRIAGLVSFNFTYQNFNFLLLGLALATYILQQILTGRLDRLEGWIRKPLVVKPAYGRVATVVSLQQSVGASGTATGGRAQDASRMSLLRDYAAAKRILGEVKKEMAFLAIDIAGSTKIKMGEEKIVVEHAFSEYKKFLERIFREFRAYKVAWTPDGVMSCFSSVEDGAAAARKLLVELDWFNRDVHQLRSKFHVRCGMNFGEVLLPENKPLEEVTDEVIDVAGHMQKYAEVDSLWVSGEVYRRLLDRNGFTRLDNQVDEHDVFAWRKPS